MKEKLFESLFIDIYFNKIEMITVDTIYRSPHNDTKSTTDFLNHLKPTLQTITKSKTQTIILGELNFNLLDYNNTSNIHTFIDSMHENGFYSLFSKPTRITTWNETLIDNAWTNIFNHSIQKGIIVDSIADHMPVILGIQLNSPILKILPLNKGISVVLILQNL